MLTEATTWLTGTNDDSHDFLDFGTKSPTDIRIKSGSSTAVHGIINGLSSTKRGYFEYYKPVGFGGNSTIGTVAPNANFSLTLKPIGTNTSTEGSLRCVNENDVELMKVDNSKIDFQQGALRVWDDQIQFNVSLWAASGNLTVDVGNNPATGKLGVFRDMFVFGDYKYGSDRRIKDNIKELEYGLGDILKLSPKIYTRKITNRIEIGFIAQEVEKVIPEIVDAPLNDSGLYTLSYMRLIPVFANAIKEQQSIIDSLKEKVNSIFASTLTKEKDNNTIQKEELNKQPILFQNRPNPFDGLTFIEYFLPSNSANAFLKVVDNNGKLVKAFPINQVGYGQIELNCNNLSSGTYYYSLLVNSQIIETKTMMITTKN